MQPRPEDASTPKQYLVLVNPFATPAEAVGSFARFTRANRQGVLVWPPAPVGDDAPPEQQWPAAAVVQATEYACHTYDAGKWDRAPVGLPGMVALEIRPSPAAIAQAKTAAQWCSATIVSTRAFLTAAHCVDPELFDFAADSAMAGQPRCEVHPTYKALARDVRVARCNRSSAGCDADVAVCTYGADVFKNAPIAAISFHGPEPGTDWSGRSRSERLLHCVTERDTAGPRVTLVGYGDDDRIQSGHDLCRANVRLCAGGEAAGAQVHQRFGIAFDHGGSFSASGDSGGAVLWPKGPSGRLVGVVTQFNFEARSTYFVDLSLPAVREFIEPRLCGVGAARNPGCDR